MIAAGFFLTSQDAMVKWLTGTYPAGEIMAIRGVFALIFAAGLIWRDGGIRTLKVDHITLHMLRVCCVIAGTVCYIVAMRYLPLATVVTITFAGPLFITAMAPRFLGEKIGWRRWCAVLAGFVGITIIFRPGIGGFEWAMLLVVMTALTSAVRDVVTRKIVTGNNSTAMLFFALATVSASGFATLPYGWVWPDAVGMALFVITGIMIGFAQLLLIIAFRYAEASTLAPCKYFSVIWAISIGYLVWGDTPDVWMISGGALVIASSLYIAHRESRLRKPL